MQQRILPVRVEFESQAKPEVYKLLEHCGEKTWIFLWKNFIIWCSLVCCFKARKM